MAPITPPPARADGGGRGGGMGARADCSSNRNSSSSRSSRLGRGKRGRGRNNNSSSSSDRLHRVIVAGLFISCCSTWLHVLQPVGAGWIDPDTPTKHHTTISHEDGSEYTLVMSDEFEVDGRSMADGDDPMWTSVTKSDDAMTSSGLGAQVYYNSSHSTTRNGSLVIKTTPDVTQWRGYNPYKKKYEQLKKYYRSSMVNTWNKFCFTGGIIEMNGKLPGKADVGGLWPAFWLLGNLGRATFEASTNLMWPWSYNVCDRKLQRAQEVSACNGVKHFNMHAHQGRGSTEIDVLEVMTGKTDPKEIAKKMPGGGLPYASTTLQLAPGLPDHRPIGGELIDHSKMTWYKNLRYGPNSTENWRFYGMSVDKTSPQEPVFRSADQAYLADALSALTKLSDTHFEDMHKWRLEWMPGKGGYLRWYLDDLLLFAVDGSSLEELMGTMIPEEPSYLILNTAVSTSWGFPPPPITCASACYDCNDSKCRCGLPPGFCATLPAEFLIDYVRVYQHVNETRQTVGCDTPTHPTRKFIKANLNRYLYMADKVALKKLKIGGGDCESTSDCHHGVCKRRQCHCLDAYVGPHCMVPHYHDDFVLDNGSGEWEIRGMQVPMALGVMAAVLAIGVVAAMVVVGLQIRKGKEGFGHEFVPLTRRTAVQPGRR